ncbi:LysR family transcriptional regulator [Desulfosporosinus fructosivorans]|uniref:LysR family transcriptional regulator n=1 Tax=Desulfosporosinus fructosivorans TaxID=2018669 RepID=A0A4Z0R8D0_9FIRM|nr:LysR family transcriptional regulator [Desulfosporosinus fructosivorans]TGE39392.1 LysR family transcriptional regulator [Desulfosporosinus fructosivorans]
MDIRHLEYFVEVARQQSFSKAATIRHVSQSAISKMIKDLETELGTSLFNRTSKYVQLTDTGIVFLDQAQQVVFMFENLTTEFNNKIKTEKGKISIGLLPITSSTIFAELLGEFKKKYPQIEIVLSEYGSKKVTLAIQDGTLDTGVICIVPDNHYFDSLPFSTDPLCVIVSSQNPISHLSSIDLASLSNESFVLYSKDFSLHDEIKNQCRNVGFFPNVIFETSQLDLMTQMVAANLGIAFLPSVVCTQLDTNRIVSLPLTHPQIIHSMSIIWKRGRSMSHATRLWLQFAENYFTSNVPRSDKNLLSI